MNDDASDPTKLDWSRFKLPLIVLGALAIGTIGTRALLTSPRPAERSSTRPIVEIVRPQASFPDLSDLVGRLCPSVAMIVPKGTDPTDNGANPVPAFAISADGWMLTSGRLAAGAALDALFGDGRRIAVSDLKTDAVSGLTIVKVGQGSLQPLALADQGFPRVGQFGFALGSPAGSGCSAGAAMVESDFLADGGGPVSDVRVGPRPDSWAAGMPFLGADGRVLGIATGGADSSVIPAPLAALVVDELIRGSPSASTRFGFRAVDFAPPLSTRLGDVRSGAGISFVQAKSPAAKAGLKAGDIATGVNDEPVSSASELNRLLDALTGPAKLSITRGSEQLSVTVKPV